MKQYFIALLFLSLLLFGIFGNKEKEIIYEGEQATSSVEKITVKETSASSSIALVATTSSSVPHLPTPSTPKALYMSSWVVSTPSSRENLVRLIDGTELNAVVIDVKDNTGSVTWETRMKEDNLKAFVEDLHKKNIYVIGRIAVFQDPHFALLHKEEAVKRPDGTLWKSRKGEYWVDTGSIKMWNHVIELGEKAHSLGFDEINLDYIRFSTEGVHDNLIFPKSGIRAKHDRVGVVSEFYKYVTDAFHARGIVVSGDVFGIITTSTIDIPVLGQDLHKALLYFDYVAPMVYPSHYAPGTFGFSNPAVHPQAVIEEAMKGGIRIADEVASSTGQATTTLRLKLRPWYQDFDMGAVYTAQMVRAQIDAGESLGISSWMLWDPSNKYTRGALK